MKEEIFEIIKEVIKELLNTDIIMYPEGSVRQEEAKKFLHNKYFFIDNKPEFIDVRDYRKSLLELISKLIDFYKEV